MCSARTNQDDKKRVQEQETQSIFILVHHTGLRPVFSAQLVEKIPLIQLIVHIQLINQFLLPVEISTLLN